MRTCEGITANGIHTYEHLDLCIAERKVAPPIVRTNRKTVPYMHGSHDFSCIAGEPIYDDTTIEYTFDIAELETAYMEEKKSQLLGFLTAIQDVDFEDDFSPEYYYHGSYTGASWEEDFGQGKLTAQLTVHPFKTAKTQTVHKVAGSLTIVNGSDCSVLPTITAEQSTTITVNGVSYSVPAGTQDITRFVLQPGNNTIVVTDDQAISIAYYERKLV